MFLPTVSFFLFDGTYQFYPVQHGLNCRRGNGNDCLDWVEMMGGGGGKSDVLMNGELPGIFGSNSDEAGKMTRILKKKLCH